MRKLLHILFFSVLIAAAIVLPAFTSMEYQGKAFRSFTIDVLNPSDRAMITSEEIKNLVIDKFGQIEGRTMVMVDLYELENMVLANPYVSSCEVYRTIEGDLVLKAMVREPLVRVINSEDDQFYLDLNGYLMPVSPAHPSHVLIASGFIPDQYISLDRSEKSLNTYADTSALQEVYPVAYYISKDNFLKSFIDQIYINDKKEIELVPKIGSQTILFGTAENAEEKLENLKTFYQKVMCNINWHTYKSINLKYKNQVVCLKSI